MAASSTKFIEDGTTELTFADGVIVRTPSALLYDSLGNPLVTNPAAAGQAGAGLLAGVPMLYNGATFDPARNPTAADQNVSVGLGVMAVGFMVADQVNGRFNIMYNANGDTVNPQRVTTAAPMLYNPASGSMDRTRTPTIFKTVSATAAGNTAIWTAPAGKKWRLMGYAVEVTNNAAMAAAGINVIAFQDVANDIGLQHSIWLPNAALTTAIAGNTTGPVDLKNGIVAAAANTALNLNIATALTAGAVRVRVWGTEE